jgi:hypothetical protein
VGSGDGGMAGGVLMPSFDACVLLRILRDLDKPEDVDGNLGLSRYTAGGSGEWDDEATDVFRALLREELEACGTDAIAAAALAELDREPS